jgi:hypothetical protein
MRIHNIELIAKHYPKSKTHYKRDILSNKLIDNIGDTSKNWN